MVEGKALVRDYLREVFSEGRLDRMDAYLAGEEFISGIGRGRHTPLADVEGR